MKFLAYVCGTLIISAQAYGAISPEWQRLHNQFDAATNTAHLDSKSGASATTSLSQAVSGAPLELTTPKTTPAPAQPDDQTTSSNQRMSPVLSILMILGIGAVVVGLAGALAGGILGGALGGALGGTWLQAWTGAKIGLLAGGSVGALVGAVLAFPVFVSIVRHS